MRKLIMTMTLIAAPAAYAGDASGFDPEAIGTCLAKDSAAACTNAGFDACMDYVAAEHGDVPVAERQVNCMDASRQAWDARLTEAYDGALTAADDKAAEQLRTMERGWIAMRDGLCEYRALTVAAGNSADLARQTCLRDETARQARLLTSLRDGGQR